MLSFYKNYNQKFFPPFCIIPIVIFLLAGILCLTDIVSCQQKINRITGIFTILCGILEIFSSRVNVVVLYIWTIYNVVIFILTWSQGHFLCDSNIGYMTAFILNILGSVIFILLCLHTVYSYSKFLNLKEYRTTLISTEPSFSKNDPEFLQGLKDLDNLA